MKLNQAYVCLLLAGLVWMATPGCESQPKKPQPRGLEKELFQPSNPTTAIPPKQVELPDYRMNVGDMLEIIFHVNTLTPEEYRFHTEDVVTIRFPYHPNYDQTATIQADGRIRLLLIGQVDMFEPGTVTKATGERVGKTAGNLEKELYERYSKYFKDADVTISFVAANKKIEELKRAITTAPRGQSRLMPVKPDGCITLPYIGDIRAYGRTIPELRAALNKAYVDAGIPELEVTAQILTVAPRKIFVMGEVYRPGLLEVSNMITLSHALAMAGGMNTRADTHKVLVIRRKDLPTPEGTIIDVDRFLTATVRVNGKEMPDLMEWRRDFWLEDYDLVYVPPSCLTKTNDWINQVFTKGIYGVMPFTTSLGLGFGYQIHNAPTTVYTKGTDYTNVIQSILNTVVK